MAGKKVEGTVYVSCLENNVSLLPFIFLSLSSLLSHHKLGCLKKVSVLE
jgi:hypothetical protein